MGDVIDNQKINQPTNQTNNSKKKKKTSTKNKKGIKKKNKKKNKKNKKKKNKDTSEHIYNVDVTKSLDMAIDHPEEDQSHYPAVVTNLKPGGQAELAGVKVGMHVHSINGSSCQDQEMQIVLNLVKECREAKKELIIILANEKMK